MNYIVEIAYKRGDITGVNYQCVEARSKRNAANKALKCPSLSNCVCCLIQIKKASKAICRLFDTHNKEVKLNNVLNSKEKGNE